MQDLYSIKKTNIPAWVGEGAPEAPFPEEELWQSVAGGEGRVIFFLTGMALGRLPTLKEMALQTLFNGNISTVAHQH